MLCGDVRCFAAVPSLLPLPAVFLCAAVLTCCMFVYRPFALLCGGALGCFFSFCFAFCIPTHFRLYRNLCFLLWYGISPPLVVFRCFARQARERWDAARTKTHKRGWPRDAINMAKLPQPTSMEAWEEGEYFLPPHSKVPTLKHLAASAAAECIDRAPEVRGAYDCWYVLQRGEGSHYSAG